MQIKTTMNMAHMNLFHRKEIYGLGEQTCGCRGEGNGIDQELGVNRCKLLPLEWISNEILESISSHL